MVHDKIETEFWIRELVANTWKEATSMFGATIGPVPIIQVAIKKSRVAGSTWQRSGIVEYNLIYACTVPRQEYAVTVVHELAHILQYRIYPRAAQAHGPEFKTIMQLLGYSDRTYHSYSVRNAKQAVNDIKTQDTLLLL